MFLLLFLGCFGRRFGEHVFGGLVLLVFGSDFLVRSVAHGRGSGSALFVECAQRLTPQLNFLLFEVSSVLFVNEHQIEIVLHTELVVHALERRSQIVRRQKQTNRNTLTANGSAVHDFEFGDIFTFVVLVWPGAGGLAFDNNDFHVFDFDAHQKEINFTNHYVLQVVFGFVVFEFDVKAVLNADFHFDGIIDFRLHGHVLYREIHRMSDVRRVVTSDAHAKEIPQSHVIAGISFVLFLHVIEFEDVLARVLERARHLQLAR